MAVRMQHCDWCGKELGIYDWSRTYDGPQSCGERECEREIRHMVQAEEADRAERAREDGYSRY